MPIISKIGARSAKIRFVYTSMFIVLIVGALSMIYPFTLMISGSMKSVADSNALTPYPKFWFDDIELFRKYAESKYETALGTIEAQWNQKLTSWEKIEQPKDAPPGVLDLYMEWRPTYTRWRVGHCRGGQLLPQNGRLFRESMYKRFDGDIDAFRREMQVPLKSWNAVLPPFPPPGRFANSNLFDRAFHDFEQTRPVYERIIFNIDGAYSKNFLIPKYGPDIAKYNEKHKTSYKEYTEILLPPIAPADGLERTDWEEYVREEVGLGIVRLSPNVQQAWRKFLEQTYTTIERYNQKHSTNCSSFDQAEFYPTAPAFPHAQADWERFIKEPAACPVEAFTLYGPRQSFEDFIAKKKGVEVSTVTPTRLPIAQADWTDCMAHKSELRSEFTSRNYKNVLGYIALHGNGILNTIIFCALAVCTALIVNPIAAYALSRYKLPSTYTILLFCMATMAFPGEVTMIPSFLLLKRFPLGPIIGGALAFTLVIWILTKLRPKWPEGIRMTIALGCAILTGAWIVPNVFQHNSVSLLNTFAALVLPGMASGFSIFLLKGFFDSLPQELYEAAEIDGAGEWTKFWMITMSLSKPILAVIALGAFTGAYGAFMMALIIIPDSRMWTLMVWLFQLQSQSHQAVVYASLVLAAIPTFLVFAFCQNLIMRGIVVPVEK